MLCAGSPSCIGNWSGCAVRLSAGKSASCPFVIGADVAGCDAIIGCGTDEPDASGMAGIAKDTAINGNSCFLPCFGKSVCAPEIKALNSVIICCE